LVGREVENAKYSCIPVISKGSAFEKDPDFQGNVSTTTNDIYSGNYLSSTTIRKK
jgi:hypothetical protein